MNRKMFEMADQKRREYDIAEAFNRSLADAYAQAVEHVLDQTSDADTPAHEKQDLQDSDTR